MAGTLTISTLSDGTNSTSATNCISGSAKAWVNFNGTGTVAIRSSYNISSITDNGTGNYTVNFTNAMTDTNYAATVSCKGDFAWGNLAITTETFNTGSLQLFSRATYNGTYTDISVISVAIFR